MQPLPFAITSSLLLACASAQCTMHAVAVTPVGIMSQNHSTSVGVPAGAPADALDLQVGGPTLPGGCALRTDASILFLAAADNLGHAVHTLTLPAPAAGTLYHHFVPVDLSTFTFRASNGLAITGAP